MRNVSSLEAIFQDYAPRGVKFYYIYKALAHPETNGYITPYTLDERLMHVREAQQKLGSRIPWLCDSMDNVLKHTLGDAPNSEFVVDPNGVIVRKRQWSRPNELRADLEQLVGPVDTPTRPEDLALPNLAPLTVAPRGVVPRISLPGRMLPLVVEPQQSEQPFYVKLRAEGEPALLQSGKGQLYLGFHCDPLYRVHWNNLAEPIRVRISAPPLVKVDPGQWSGPRVEAPADMDPREVLVDISGWHDAVLRVTVEYFACNDEEGWCKPVHQEYLVYAKQDRDGGTVRRSNAQRRSDAPVRPRADQPRQFGPPPGRPLQGLIEQLDIERRVIHLRTPRGVQTLRVAEEVRIVLNGRPATLDELCPGWRVNLRLAPGQNGPQIIAIQSRTPPPR